MVCARKVPKNGMTVSHSKQNRKIGYNENTFNKNQPDTVSKNYTNLTLYYAFFTFLSTRHVSCNTLTLYLILYMVYFVYTPYATLMPRCNIRTVGTHLAKADLRYVEACNEYAKQGAMSV